MNRLLLALSLLASGCATNIDEGIDTVSVQRHQRLTRVVAAQQPQETRARSIRLVGEPNTPPTRARMVVSAPLAVPSAPVVQTPTPPTVVQIIVQQPPPQKVDFIQVGPPIIQNTTSAPPAPAPASSYQAPAATPPLVRSAPGPIYTPTLETAEGMSYQNGGVNGTTTPSQPTPASDLTTAEGLQYRP